MNRKGPGTALAALALAASASAAGPDPSSLLPPDQFAPGWRRAAAPEVFTGAELYDHIDGAGEVFLELGFERVAVQDFTDGREALTVEVYVMRDGVAAAAIYLLKCGREERHPRLTGRHAFSPGQVLLAGGNVIAILTSDTGAGATEAMLAAAAAIGERLPAPGPIPLVDRLPAEGMVPGSFRIARGPFTLQRVYTFGEGDVLLLDGTVAAVAADYADGRGGAATRIVADYADAARARGAFDHLLASLDPGLELRQRTPSRVVFRDWAARWGVVELLGDRVEAQVNLSEPPAATAVTALP